MRAADDVSELRWFPLDKIAYRQIAFPVVRKVLSPLPRPLTELTR